MAERQKAFVGLLTALLMLSLFAAPALAQSPSPEATEPAATEPAATDAETPAGQTPPDTAVEMPGSTPGDSSNTIFLLFVIGAIAAVLLTAGLLGSRQRATASADKEPPH